MGHSRDTQISPLAFEHVKEGWGLWVRVCFRAKNSILATLKLFELIQTK